MQSCGPLEIEFETTAVEGSSAVFTPELYPQDENCCLCRQHTAVAMLSLFCYSVGHYTSMLPQKPVQTQFREVYLSAQALPVKSLPDRASRLQVKLSDADVFGQFVTIYFLHV